MKIAFFADSYKPYLSGVTNSMELLVKELRELGHRVYIFAPRYPHHVDTDPDIIRFPSLPTRYPKFRLAIPYIHRLPEVDLIHSHSPFQIGMLARYVAHRRHVPLVYTFHTLFTRYLHYAKFVPEPISKLAMVNYIREFCRRTNLIIAPSKMSKRVLRVWGVKNRIEVVPSGVDMERVSLANAEEQRKAIRKKYKIPENAMVLLYVGRITKEKNIGFLLRAFERLTAGFSPPVYLLLVGGGPLLEALSSEKREKVILTGEVNYPEVLSYYAVGDLFVFSSTTETQGLVLAEAKALGLPVVALFAGGLVETVRSGEDGYLVPRNLGRFLEHLRRLIDDPALRLKLGHSARLDALDRFASGKIAKRMETLYNSLVA
ncbi:glycosyltransferase [Candidatus Saganbacteria bacterium]|nr:glycosyltransferase [Candidatus Saganbacteria bacterium]